MSRKTPADIDREIAELQATRDLRAGIARARELLDTVKTDLRAGEKAGGSADDFAPALSSVDALRAVVGRLAGVDPLP